MAEKIREASARGEITRLTRLLDDGIKPLPDEVNKFIFNLNTNNHIPVFFINLDLQRLYHYLYL